MRHDVEMSQRAGKWTVSAVVAGLVLLIVGEAASSLVAVYFSIGLATVAGIFLIVVGGKLRRQANLQARDPDQRIKLDERDSLDWELVDQPDLRFRAETKKVLGPFYALRIVDLSTGDLVPESWSGALAGRGSVRRAAKQGIRRYLHKDPRLNP